MAHYLITNLRKDEVAIFRFPDNRKAESIEDWSEVEKFYLQQFPGDDVEVRIREVDTMQVGDRVVIYNDNGMPIRSSKNLRGILDYSRTNWIKEALATRNPSPNARTEGEGILTVVWGNGSFCTANFASFECLCDFLKNRRSWAKARRIEDGGKF